MWIAKDFDGRIHMYLSKPVKNEKEQEWCTMDAFCPRITEDFLPEKIKVISWYDVEPIEVELIIAI